ncbi:MAG TPA: NADH-quinone oxidoreductase subunit L [Burkholderiaceae bacterium]|nr:NADH-quinone oxidoreductase subunit L [Burkholderiaceae bacterium]
MDLLQLTATTGAALPPVLMLLAMGSSRAGADRPAHGWKVFNALSTFALVAALAALALPWWAAGAAAPPDWPRMGPWAQVTALGAVLAVLVQFLGTVIGAFSARYLQGEARQARYSAGLAGVLAAVQVLLLADHWVPLIAAWALVGVVLERLLCFYADRPFALLAAHKKRMADRLADAMMVGAAALAWSEVGTGSLSDLATHLSTAAPSAALQASALLLVVAVILRTALLPVHGWLIQVMEAPTPVSALLHAGVVNLGGYVLIRLAPLLEHSAAARWLLLGIGLATAVLAGMVMLTRVSIKVRLAWSTVAQMGFMVLECALGLYTLAALHLVGHSLYKAHAFLAASDVVREVRIRALRGAFAPMPASVWCAPLAAWLVVGAVQAASGGAPWPWWWSMVMGLAWAPVLWLPTARPGGWRDAATQAFVGLLLAAALTALAHLAHALPLGLADAPATALGVVAAIGMALLYLGQAMVQLQPQALSAWRRWSYAGFYLDEFFTRLALRAWPARWTPQASAAPRSRLSDALAWKTAR